MKKYKTKRQIQAKHTKQKIYQTALALFAKKGYGAVTIEEICSKCQLSKGAFYVHFNSKHDIMVEQSKWTDKAHMRYYQSLPLEISSAEKLRRFIIYIVNHAVNEKGMEAERVIYKAELEGKKKPGYITDKNRPLYSCIKAIVDEGQKKGEFRRDLKLDDIMCTIICVIRGLLYDWLINDGSYNIDTICICTIEVILHGILDYQQRN